LTDLGRPGPAGNGPRLSPSTSLRLQILGPLRLWRDGVELDAGPRQQAYLLALLLARPGRPISTNNLIDFIWDGAVVPASALNVIHKYIGALRRLLQPGLPARGTGSYLLRRGNGYVFMAGPGELDAVTFRHLIGSAKTSLAEPRDDQAALDHYAEALGLWHGSAGEGLAYGSGATSVFAGLDGEFSDVCAAAAELAVALGRPERVLKPLQLAAGMAPLHEPVQAALIAALSAAGKHAEAVMVFHAVRKRLSDELGIDPGAAVQAAYLDVLTRTTSLVDADDAHDPPAPAAYRPIGPGCPRPTRCRPRPTQAWWAGPRNWRRSARRWTRRPPAAPGWSSSRANQG
jgi:DNA-binding SARP family transcriptional activator